MPEIIGEKFVAGRLPRPAETAHKGECGRLGVIAGSYGMAGAAALCANAAYRSGAGLVRLFVPQSIYSVVAVLCPNAVFTPYENPDELRSSDFAGLDALAAGCGLGRGDAAARLMEKVAATGLPFVLDADGINAYAGRLNELKGHEAIITPHSGEAARALGITVNGIESDRETSVKALALQSGCVAVLKGSRSLVSDGETVRVCDAGNNGMATAGSGDVLTGVIGALLAGGCSPVDAAACGVFIHATAGDTAAAELSRRSTVASDIINSLPPIFKRLEKIAEHGEP